MPAQRIGIITAGGDCAGLNAVIRGLVCTAAGRQMDVIGFAEGYEGLLNPSTARPLTLADINKLAASFRFTLLNMMHSRIAYTQEEEKQEREEIAAKALA